MENCWEEMSHNRKPFFFFTEIKVSCCEESPNRHIFTLQSHRFPQHNLGVSQPFSSEYLAPKQRAILAKNGFIWCFEFSSLVSRILVGRDPFPSTHSLF